MPCRTKFPMPCRAQPFGPVRDAQAQLRPQPRLSVRPSCGAKRCARLDCERAGREGLSDCGHDVFAGVSQSARQNQRPRIDALHQLGNGKPGQSMAERVVVCAAAQICGSTNQKSLKTVRCVKPNFRTGCKTIASKYLRVAQEARSRSGFVTFAGNKCR